MKISLLIFSTFLIITGFKSCQSEHGNGCTPKKFLNQFKNDKKKYSVDSANICKGIEVVLKAHKDFFYSKEFFDKTYIIVDTIIYDKTFTKMIIFIIAKNPTYRQLSPDTKHIWYYSGTCYLAFKKDNQSLNLSWLGPSFTNSTDQKDLSKIMRETYFCEFGLQGKINSISYNLNDVRFFDSSIWDSNFLVK